MMDGVKIYAEDVEEILREATIELLEIEAQRKILAIDMLMIKEGITPANPILIANIDGEQARLNKSYKSLLKIKEEIIGDMKN